ncbi:MAG: hypothetical protein HY814_04490 [Candidatus Riflebacteria bacterium]|nr:hypothetical protein [Candidatus Riflebacteria bacterium]
MTEPAKRFILKIGEIYEIDKGLAAVEEDLRHSRKARFSNLRPDLIERFLGCIDSFVPAVEVYTALAEHTRPLASRGLAKLGTCKSQWYQDFLGTRVQMGEVLMPTALYHILWTDDKIHRVFGINDPAYISFIWKKNLMMKLEDEQLFMTVYDREQGLSVIHEKARKASVFRMLVLPARLVHAILPHALGGDYRIILSRLDPLVEEYAADSDIRYGSDAKIFMVYGGEEANVGSIRLNHELYSVIWRGQKVFAVMKYENLIFANYFGRAFDTAWKYSKKQKLPPGTTSVVKTLAPKNPIRSR